jgi:hypothetical protein
MGGGKEKKVVSIVKIRFRFEVDLGLKLGCKSGK